MRRIRFGLLLTSAGLAAVASAQSSVTLDAFQKGKKVGTVKFARTIKAGIQNNVTTITIDQNGKSVVLVMTGSFNAKGSPLSKSLTVNQGADHVNIKATFSKAGAKVSIATGKQNVDRTVPLATSTSVDDASTWWLLTSKPKPGAKVKYQSFSMNTLKWEEIESVFVGPAQVKVGTKTVKAFEITQKRGSETSTIYVDDKAMPIVIEQPNMRFVRRS